ncbi:hypothetical protein ACN28C_10600 [Plantactinospora sp. WMMC1484]|uniref:hypothetical protein n=1 Tax=Plantactinospora sp. WMMC1484 TaxID=3404122 RepID=UPI003BF57AE2
MDATALASRARQSRGREVLPELLALAGDPAAGDDRWQAAASAIELLLWTERPGDAAELAESVITAEADTALAKQDFPFDTALLAADLHAGIPAGPRLRRLAGLPPAGSVLARRLDWLAGRLDGTGPAALLPNHHDWGGAPGALGPVGEALRKQPYATLRPNQRRALWSALESANDIDAARRLRGAGGDDPPSYPGRVWLAGWAVHDGDPAEAERLLLSAAPLWRPYASWDCLPTDLAVEPTLRRAVTPAVWDRYLSGPLGPEASEGEA